MLGKILIIATYCVACGIANAILDHETHDSIGVARFSSWIEGGIGAVIILELFCANG